MPRQAFGAKLLGGRSSGSLRFGDLTPYLLPRSGLVLWLATHWLDWRDVEMTGLPVDLALHPGTPIADVVAMFDPLYEAAGQRRPYEAGEL